MNTIVIFATILFNGQVENLEYKGNVFANQQECTEYIAKNGNHISTTLKKHLDKVYPNSSVLIIACSDKTNFVSNDETV
tara:strand:- start:31 stop:267 length:237 start_codon:yes stop_codon:yes gene_type:complete